MGVLGMGIGERLPTRAGGQLAAQVRAEQFAFLPFSARARPLAGALAFEAHFTATGGRELGESFGAEICPLLRRAFTPPLESGGRVVLLRRRVARLCTCRRRG